MISRLALLPAPTGCLAAQAWNLFVTISELSIIQSARKTCITEAGSMGMRHILENQTKTAFHSADRGAHPYLESSKVSLPAAARSWLK